MTALRSSSTHTDVAILLIVVGVVVAAGSAVLGTKPTMIAVAVPVVAAAALYVIRRPLVVLIAMAVIEVTNLAWVVAARTEFPVFRMSLVLGLLTVGIALRDPVMRGRINRWTLFGIGLVACYLTTQLLAALESQNFAVSITTLRDTVINCTFLVVLVLLAQLTARPWAVAAAIVLPMAAISVLCLVNQVAFGGTLSFGGFATATKATGELVTTLRFGGPGMDSNFWGRHLILALPLAGALIVRAVQSGRRLVTVGWAVAMLALLAGVYLTQSRGAIITTAVVFLVWVLASGPAARRRGLMSLPLVILVLFVPGVGNRLVALVADVYDSTASYGVDPSVLGREAAQETAWAMFRDRPIFGFGPGVFEASIPKYAGIVPTAVLHPTDAPHNLYAQLAAEGGIIGLTGWIILVGWFIGCMAIRVARAVPTGSDRSLAAAVLAALVGWSVASVFLHLAYFRTFAIVLALAGALASAPAPKIGRAVRVRSGRMREVAVGAMLGIAGAAIVMAVSRTETHVASQTVTLLPTEQIDRYHYAYALDVRSRKAVLPTYAAMMAANAPGATAVGDAVRGVITIRVAAADTYSARAGLDIALANAYTNLANFGVDSYYAIAPVGQVKEDINLSRSSTATPVAIITAAASAASTALIMPRILPSRSRRRQQGAE